MVLLRLAGMELGPAIEYFESLIGACAVPGVAVAALGGEFIYVVMNGLVAVAEDGLAGGDAVVARPDGAGSGRWFQVTASGCVSASGPLLSIDGGGFEPSDAVLNCRDDLWRWMRQAHEIEEQIGALAAGEGRRFKVAA